MNQFVYRVAKLWRHLSGRDLYGISGTHAPPAKRPSRRIANNNFLVRGRTSTHNNPDPDAGTHIVCVLRSGGEYHEEHVSALAAQVARFCPKAKFSCLSDVDLSPHINRISMQYSWPKWWSKMELFRPDIKGHIFYVDLDTLIIGDISKLASDQRLMMLRDVYLPEELQSSVMSIPESVRGEIWSNWIANPDAAMCAPVEGVFWSDQEWLEQFWLNKTIRFQDAYPDALVSYKADFVEQRGIPSSARIVFFHGPPRPWQTDLWERYAYPYIP